MMARKDIHVHINNPRRARTNDGDGDGRWITVSGAHVHIGEGGKIDKGPKELVGKGEHEAHQHQHNAAAEKHTQHAIDKGKDHPDTTHHYLAAQEHRDAAHKRGVAHHLVSAGEVKTARAYTDAADKHAAKAAEHESKVGAGESGEADKPTAKPLKHEAIHNEAADDVKGSAKHEAEHKRLLGLYGTSKAKWEQDAVNRLIQNNGTAGAQAKAQTAHHVALAHSEHANKSEDVLAHRQAQESINRAIDLHGKAGGVGYAVKQKELAARLKEHDKFVAKADKASGETGRNPAQKPMSSEAHAAQAEVHRQAGKAAIAKGDHRGATAHGEAEELHYKAQKAAVNATGYSSAGPAQHAAHAEASAAAQAATAAIGKKPGPVDHGAAVRYHEDTANRLHQQGSGAREAVQAHRKAAIAHGKAASSKRAKSEYYDHTAGQAEAASQAARDAERKAPNPALPKRAPGSLMNMQSDFSKAAKASERILKKEVDQDPKNQD